MSAAVASGALSAPQSASDGLGGLRTREAYRSRPYGALRPLPRPTHPETFRSPADTHRSALSATHSPERGLKAFPGGDAPARRSEAAVVRPTEPQPPKGNPMTDTTTPDTRRHLHLVIDRSGSMSGKRTDTEGGIAALLAEQAEIAAPTTVTLVDFDTEVRFVYELADIHEVPAYKLVPRGMTALLDAVGESITTLKQQIKAMPKERRPIQVVFVIMTDGEENSSKEWELEPLRALIEKRRAKGWEFLFLGADVDAFSAASAMGIGSSTTMSYAGTSAGTQSAFAATSRVITDGTQSGLYVYSDDDRDRASGLS